MAFVIAVLAAFGAVGGGRAVAEEHPSYTVNVRDVNARVGEHAVMLVTLTPRDGCRILHAYHNRVGQLSSFDDGVAFDEKVVAGTVRNEALVFAIGLVVTKPGKHPINGVFRVGCIEGDDAMGMISVPLIANIVGTE